jgi:hypothetical protein
MPDAILQCLSGTSDDRRYDLIITQIVDGEYGGQLDVAALRALCEKVVFTPIFVFRGFHPDKLECFDREGRVFFNATTGIYHSAILVASVQLGLPVDRVPVLYNTLVFRAAGYDQVFHQAKRAVLEEFASHGYELDSAFNDWSREGVFMHTDNHPCIRVLGTLARQVLMKAAFPIANLHEAPDDYLALHVQWPVYPDLAKLLHMTGSANFVRGTHNVPEGQDRALTLNAWVRDAYHDYVASPNLSFYPTWLIDSTIAALEQLVVRS